MTPTPTVILPAGSGARRWPSILLGFLLMLPAAVCCGSTLLAPTVQTFLLSEQKNNLLGPVSFVGLANYAQLGQLPSMSRALSFTMEIAITRLLAVLIVPVLLAVAAGALGRWVGGGLRLLFMLPLALFAPTGLAVAWWVERTPGNNPLATIAGAQNTLLILDGAQTLGLACGLGLIAYLAVIRGAFAGARNGRNVGGALLLTWIVGGLAAICTALQVFSLPYLLTRGGPGFATTTLVLLQYQLGFVGFQFGPAAAVAILVLVPLLAMGLLTGLLLAATGARIEHTSDSGAATPLMPMALAVALVVVLGLAAFGLWATSQWPWLQAARLALGGGSEQAVPIAWGNTLVGPATVLLVQLPLAYLAALGIGALRPLGRRSEWLLLPFSPWLFITVGPLSLAHFMSLRQSGHLNTIAALAPPLLVGVPMLFVLTLFFKGRARGWRAARVTGRSALGAFLGQVVGPSIPLALLVGVLGMLVSNQELLWPLLAANKPELATGNVALALQLGRLAAGRGGLAQAAIAFVLPGFVFSLITLAALQLAYVGRLAVRIGPEEESVSSA